MTADLMTRKTPLVMASMVVVLAACGRETTQESRGAASPPAAATEAPAQRATPAPTAASAPAPASAPSAPASARPGCAQNFAAFDANADGRLSREEFLARPHALPNPEGIFGARDADTDGALTSAEFCSGWGAGGGPHMSAGPGIGPGAGARGMGPARGPGMGMGPGAMGPGMSRGRGPHCEAHFARFDANADGNVTEAEFVALPHPHADAHDVFAARDQDHDGLLTKAEFCTLWSGPSTPAAPTPP
jgi:Ca2+-binding EF-hand superfamily protein